MEVDLLTGYSADDDDAEITAEIYVEGIEDNTGGVPGNASPLYVCKMPLSGASALMYLSENANPNELRAGMRVTVVAVLDVEASAKLYKPVFRIIRFEEIKFVPDDFSVPRVVETGGFRLRPLTVFDVVKDYEAVMSSRDRLRAVFGPKTTWPSDTMSLQQNLADLRMHQTEFLQRKAFCYAVFTPDESRELGCVYLYKSNKAGFDAKAFLWVRDSEVSRGYDGELFEFIQAWLSEAWPFERVAYPGRSISWDEFNALPDR